MFPFNGVILYKYRPNMKTATAMIIKMAGTPKAREKQSSTPKQCTSSRKIGVTELKEGLL
jgi:hypothetical protein